MHAVGVDRSGRASAANVNGLILMEYSNGWCSAAGCCAQEQLRLRSRVQTQHRHVRTPKVWTTRVSKCVTWLCTTRYALFRSFLLLFAACADQHVGKAVNGLTTHSRLIVSKTSSKRFFAAPRWSLAAVVHGFVFAQGTAHGACRKVRVMRTHYTLSVIPGQPWLWCGPRQLPTVNIPVVQGLT
jgi:hypothetical protein